MRLQSLQTASEAFSKNYLIHGWHQAVTCVCKTRKRNAIHLRVSGPVISLKVPELNMADTVKLMGVDFGTTTSSAVIAGAQLRRTATGLVELDCEEELYRSEMVFTPLLADDRLDLAQVERLLDGWLAAGQVKDGELFGGGALLTGLTAQKENAPALVRLIRRRLGDTLVATADDPCLESWLAFMGSCAGLSREYPEKAIVNFDVGGGTTNIALGQNRQVTRTGCLFLGARHVQVVPGTYRIVKLSSYARDLFDHLHISTGPGADLTPSEVDAVLTFYVTLLEAVVTGQVEPFQSPIVNRLEQVPFNMPAVAHDSNRAPRPTDRTLSSLFPAA
jgi:ethanolamine utilization protein EutA